MSESGSEVATEGAGAAAPKGVVRMLFQSRTPVNEEETVFGSLLVVEATPKPDGRHRYWGVVGVEGDMTHAVVTEMGAAGRTIVSPLHSDVEWPDGEVGRGFDVDVPLMALHFRACPSSELLPDRVFQGDLLEWVESIGYQLLDVPDDDDYQEQA